MSTGIDRETGGMIDGGQRAHTHGLRAASLGPWAVLGQSLANICASGAPLISIPVVASNAGCGTWISFSVATTGVVLVAFNINVFARDASGTASLCDYIARSMGTTAGVLGSWALAIAYIGTGIACAPLFGYYLNSLLAPFHLHIPLLPFNILLLLAVWFFAWKDMRLSAHLMLTIEFSAMAIGTLMAATILYRLGLHVDLQQFSFHSLSPSAIGRGSILAFMAAVGFESAASVGDEARNPLKNIPRVIVGSGIIAGFYYVLNAYAMVAGFHAISADMARSQAPALDVARANGVAILAVLLTISGLVTSFSVVLACIVAGTRTLFQLAQHGVLPAVFRHVHARNRTPDTAVHAATLIALAVVVLMTLAGIAPPAIWDYVGSISTFGFLLAYLLLSVGAPIYLHRSGSLRSAHLVVASLAVVAVSIPLVSSIFPVPDYPHNLMIYIFVALLAVGMGWFLALRWRRPAIDAEIAGYLKKTYQSFALERIVNPDAAP